MSTVINIGGSTISAPRTIIPLRLVAHVLRGTPTFTFQCRGGPLPTSTDPYLGKAVTVTIGGTLRFTGDVIRRDLEFRGRIGWVRTYQCAGLRQRGDRVPHTDGNNGSDSSSYNLQQDNQAPEYLAARAGRTVGQILTDVLLELDNAQGLNGLGIGQYTGLPSSPALPSATVSDLAALTMIPPSPVRFGGEKLLNAVEGFLDNWAPNHSFSVEPDGTLRIRDLRSYSASTLTLNTDPILPTPLSRDVSQCFQRVVVRGQQVAEMFVFSLANGTLSESPFAHDSLSVAAAKAAWTQNDYFKPGSAWEGTCTCPTTGTVTVTPVPAAAAVASNYWDQTSTGKHGFLSLTDTAGSSITMICQRNVTASTAYSGSGTCTLTLDRALAITSYTNFMLRGTHSGASSVWCEYALPSWAAAKVAKQSTYLASYKFAGNTAETLTSTPLGTVCWSNTHSAPFEEGTVPITVDPSAGTVRFGYPTYLTAGSRAPDDVRALVPIYTATNTAIKPPDSGGSPTYTGTSHSAEALSYTLTITVDAWRDPLNLSAMQTYAQEWLDAVKDAVIEGSVTYLGLYTAGLTPGLALSIAGNGYTTGWESAALPVVETQLEWGVSGSDAMNYRTTMRCSNRRTHLTDAAFLHPSRTGLTFDWGDHSIGIGSWMNAVPNAISTALYGTDGHGGLAGTMSQANAITGMAAATSPGVPNTGPAGPQWTGGVFAPMAGGNNLASTGRDTSHTAGPKAGSVADQAATDWFKANPDWLDKLTGEGGTT